MDGQGRSSLKQRWNVSGFDQYSPDSYVFLIHDHSILILCKASLFDGESRWFLSLRFSILDPILYERGKAA